MSGIQTGRKMIEYQLQQLNSAPRVCMYEEYSLIATQGQLDWVAPQVSIA